MSNVTDLIGWIKETLRQKAPYPLTPFERDLLKQVENAEASGSEDAAKRVQENVTCQIQTAVVEERESICTFLVRSSLGSVAEQVRDCEHLVHRTESRHAKAFPVYPDYPDGIP